MGSDKALLELDGVSFAQRVVNAAAGVFDEVVLVGKDHAEIGGTRAIRDTADLPPAAISGVITALRDAASERNWILAVDYPLLTADVLRFLAQRFAAAESEMVVPVWDGEPQLLCAGYSVKLLPRLESMIALNRFRLRDLVEQSNAQLIDESELRRRFGGEPLRNVNHRHQYDELRSANESR